MSNNGSGPAAVEPIDHSRGVATGLRRIRLTAQPSISCVVTSVEAQPELEARLHLLTAECVPNGVEIVVARMGNGDELERLRSAFPTVRFVSCPAGSSTADLRSAGMAEAEGDIVAMLDGRTEQAGLRLSQLVRLANGDHSDRQTAEEAVAINPSDDIPGVRRVDRLRPGDHVVIIGAGPGGLTPAYLLAKKGVHVTVLEADDMVGGISRTAQYKGYRFDIGGHRFFTKIKPVDDLWHEILGPEFISVPRLSRIHYDGKFFDYPLKAMNALRGLGVWRAITIVISYLYAHLRPSPVEDNLEQWVINRFGRRLYEIFFKTYTEKVWGIPCTEIRAEWAAQRIQNLSLARAILSAASLTKRSTKIKTLINEFKYPRLGPGQMWEACRDRVEEMGGRVLMRHNVERFEVEDGRVVALWARSPEGPVRIAGDHFISTMPIKNLVQALDPAPPPAVRQAGEGLKYRDFLAVALILDGENLFPDNWIYIHTPGVQVGRIQNFNNWSRAMVPDPGRTCLGMEYFCFEGDELWTAPDDELIRLATAELKNLELDGGAHVVDGTVVRMPKAYPVYDAVYRQHLDVARAYLDCIPNLHLVGRNGMHKYNNQDHSMLTAMMTVWNLEGADHDVWAVNTDFEYHEEQRVEPAAPPAKPALAAAG
jgi:protoporphyrinogen oxidase